MIVAPAGDGTGERVQEEAGMIAGGGAGGDRARKRAVSARTRRDTRADRERVTLGSWQT